MPAALYAIAFKKTGHVLAIVSFEKRALADSAASEKLLNDLIGDRLTISVSSGGSIAIAAGELVLDPIKDSVESAGAAVDPYGYQVEYDADKQPGDGQDKTLFAANEKTVKSFGLKATGELSITLTLPEGTIPDDAYVVFEGAPSSFRGSTVASQPDFKLAISGLTLAATASYGFVLLKSGVPATPGFVVATP